MAFESGLDNLMREGAKMMTQTISGIIAGIGEKVSTMWSSLSEASPDAGASVIDSGKGFMARMHEAITGSFEGKEVAIAEPARVREPEIAPPTTSMKNNAQVYEFSAGDLGTLSPSASLPKIALNVDRGAGRAGSLS